MRFSAKALLIVCVLAAFAPLAKGRTVIADVAVQAEWPAEWEGRALVQLPLTGVEESFVAQGFPGAIGRFTDGERTYILRHIERPSRRVHSIAECLRTAGWNVTPTDPARDRFGVMWSNFSANLKGDVLQFREVILDGDGNSFSDVGAWYWAAARGSSVGPWMSVTEAATGR